MIGHRVLGLSLLCAFLFCALAAPSAMAESKTTTAYTCAPVESKAQFSDEHCLKGTGEGKGFVHQELVPFSLTEITGTNEKTASETKSSTNTALKGITEGSEVEIICTGASTTGRLQNAVTEKGEMLIEGEEIVITFTSCTVAKPAKGNCKVKGGKIETLPNRSTTLGKGMAMEFFPGETPWLGEVVLEGCTNEKLNKHYKIEGTLIAPITGATWSTTEAQTTAEKTFKVGGFNAGLETSITLRMKEGNPVVPTTIVDP
jgi:hypothetical protein